MAIFETTGQSEAAARAKARARANFALVKYWGKADTRLNVPAVGSISITLDSLWSDTSIELDPSLAADDFVLDGARRPEQSAKVSACLDLLRERAGVATRARVVSSNNFPTGAGLASSASGFAALVTAASSALRLDLSPRELSIFARFGSGSAARSVFGGFVEMHAGRAADGGDSYAEPLLDGAAWPLEVVIAVTAKGEKEVGSRSGMTRSAELSPYYSAWVATQPPDLDAARTAIASRDFAALAEVAEHNCLKMHAAALAARPGLVYWNGATVECLHAVRRLRAEGAEVFFTIDAGPQVKAICTAASRPRVAAALRGVPGVVEVVASRLGPGAELV
ncbi:MAG TPA: diphosphomevalonate decarboxylase [Gammaproteobacteria bacterium]|nr:diphosphomevalonate decarboxylase [Gammaproteobacteria bacterium]